MKALAAHSVYHALEFDRPHDGPSCPGVLLPEGLSLSGKAGWQSNGGPHKRHPARAMPYSVEMTLPQDGRLDRLYLVAVAALYAGPEHEPKGNVGATLLLMDGEELVHRVDLISGKHYNDAEVVRPVRIEAGDGVCIETVGQVEIAGAPARVDLFSIDIPTGIRAKTLVFRDFGGPASFVIFDAIAEVEPPHGCPFHSQSGGVSLSELGAVLRVGDRARFMKALAQLEESLLRAEDLDEARGEALTFLAVVTASTLELGGDRSMHRAQLEAARAMDRLQSVHDIAKEVRERIGQLAPWLFAAEATPNAQLMDRALALIDRNYARKITDSEIAAQLGLSTSHFRFLFRQTTGQPFHKYLIALRLEKGRRMLVEQGLPVSEVARAVGFTGLSHFSRAFAQRFSVSPTSVRRAVG